MRATLRLGFYNQQETACNKPGRMLTNQGGGGVNVREMFFLKSIQMVEGSGVHWFAGVLQSLCSPS